jgi:hypothetical protein
MLVQDTRQLRLRFPTRLFSSLLSQLTLPKARPELMGHSRFVGLVSEAQVRRNHVTICKYSVSLTSSER